VTDRIPPQRTVDKLWRLYEAAQAQADAADKKKSRAWWAYRSAMDKRERAARLAELAKRGVVPGTPVRLQLWTGKSPLKAVFVGLGFHGWPDYAHLRADGTAGRSINPQVREVEPLQ
jgi:hypothetical protein